MDLHVYLDWFLKSGLEMKYTKKAINGAYKNGKFKILDWFKNAGLRMPYSPKYETRVLEFLNVGYLL